MTDLAQERRRIAEGAFHTLQVDTDGCGCSCRTCFNKAINAALSEYAALAVKVAVETERERLREEVRAIPLTGLGLTNSLVHLRDVLSLLSPAKEGR